MYIRAKRGEIMKAFSILYFKNIVLKEKLCKILNNVNMAGPHLVYRLWGPPDSNPSPTEIKFKSPIWGTLSQEGDKEKEYA